MTCLFHPDPVADCMACLGRWDRPLAERLLREGCSPARIAAALRAAMAEIDRVIDAFSGELPAIEARHAADLAEAAAIYAAMRAEIEALRCGDLDAFHDGELSPARAEAFREHLGRCERCAAGLDGLLQETMATNGGG